MRKRVFGRHLKRDTNERKALFKNLMTELVLHEKITTTEEKAKSIKGQIEKLITKAKRKGQQSEYLLQPYLSDEAVKKVITDIAPRFTTRPGGYTRLIKLGNRFSDNASLAVIELTERVALENKLQEVRKENKEETKEILEPGEIQEAEIVSEEPKKTKRVKKEVKAPTETKEKKQVTKKEEAGKAK